MVQLKINSTVVTSKYPDRVSLISKVLENNNFIVKSLNDNNEVETYFIENKDIEDNSKFNKKLLKPEINKLYTRK